jgi:hypothetical protein
MGIVWEPRVRGMSVVGSHYQATGEDTAGLEDSMHAVMDCSVCELVIVL